MPSGVGYSTHTYRYEPDPEPQGITLSRSASSRKVSETEAQRVSRTNLLREESSLGEGPSEDLPVEEQVKLLREEREQLRAMYDTVSTHNTHTYERESEYDNGSTQNAHRQLAADMIR